MSSKSAETEKSSTTKETKTINGSFSFEGEKVYDISEEFLHWCSDMEAKYSCRLKANRSDYNNYPTVDKTK